MQRCEWIAKGAGVVCRRCKTKRGRPIVRACGRDRSRVKLPPTPPLWLSARRFLPWHDDDTGLGDFLAHKLDSAGVTKARWLKFAKRIGAVPKDAKTCGCEARQAELNRRFPRGQGRRDRSSCGGYIS